MGTGAACREASLRETPAALSAAILPHFAQVATLFSASQVNDGLTGIAVVCCNDSQTAIAVVCCNDAL